MDLEINVQYLKGVGPKMAAKLKKLGVVSVSDLIYYFPRDYRDYTQITKIKDLKIFNSQFSIHNFQTVKVKIINIVNRRTSRRRFTVTEAVVADDSGSLKVVWFNQPYLAKMLKAGQEIILNGKVAFDSYSGMLLMESPNRAAKAQIVPVYPETQGISSYYIAKLVESIRSKIESIKEFLPVAIIKEYDLFGIQQTLANIHFPKDSKALEKARERLAFDELFLFSLQKQLAKQEVRVQKAPELKIDRKFLQNFVKKLPFKLTDAQRKASWQVILDLTKDRPMNRLLNGDVGSGKTVVAAFAAAVVIKNGYRVALMAPTEILANQHFETLNKVLTPFKISVGLVTSSSNKLKVDSCPSRPRVEPRSNKLVADILVGTHALLHLKEPIENLGLVIIDEQHRFGVDQRSALIRNKTQETNSKQKRPHYLSMTATPIPRTMSSVVFADLDVSVIDEMPANRKKVITRVVQPVDRQKAYDFIRGEIKKGHQTFVICPLIEESLQLTTYDLQLFEEERKSVIKEYKKLSKEIFPDLKVAMLHGKLKSKEKEAIMADFKAKKSDILVSTSVVEVGVDIPNATVMVVEDAERFGLAQLHQFRGRVGRSDKQSYCLLISSSSSEDAKKRLVYLESISSGFVLAEKDLKLRGPGKMYGQEQSGFWDFRFADVGDRIMIERTTEAAKNITVKIGKYPMLVEKVGEALQHLE